MRNFRSTVAVASVAVLALVAPTRAAELSGADVEALLKGNTFNTEDFGGTGTITWNDDMTIAVSITKPDGTSVEDTGTFRFDGTGYCSTWKTLRTTEKCFKLSATGEGTWDILNQDGSFDSRISRQ